jgi:hypothetical protein
MTVTTTASTVSYTGDGVTTDYAVPFPALVEQDLYVLVDNVIQTVGVDYNIVGDITQPGATVSFTAPPADTLAVFFQRLTGLVQSTEYTTYGEYKAAQHEADFDKAMYIAQENRDAAAGVGGVLPVGLFQTEITLINADSGSFGNAVISYAGNIAGGAGFRTDLPDNGTLDTWSVSLYDNAGNQREIVFSGDGSLFGPERYALEHPTTPAFGQDNFEYGVNVSSNPRVRYYLSNQGDLTGVGMERVFEWVDQTNATRTLTMDAVSGHVLVDQDPTATDVLALATVGYVNGKVGAHAKGNIVSDGVGAQDITNTQGVASVTVTGNGFRVVMSAALPMARQVITLSSNGAGGLLQTSVHYTKIDNTTFDVFVTADDVPAISSAVDFSFRVEDATL